MPVIFRANPAKSYSLMRRICTFVVSPAFVVLLMAILLVATAIALAGGDSLALARLGTRFSQADPQGSEGYDGQFVYYIALHPSPRAVAAYLDVPAYRYQRILLPLLTRMLALGSPALVPWILPLIGILALTIGTWALSELLVGWGTSRWYALVYGYWAGFSLALVVDLPEPLAYGLVVCGILALERNRNWLGWCLLGLAVFARETTLLFVVAALAAYLSQGNFRQSVGLSIVALVPFMFFQAWLWVVFGQPGLASGGAMATPFELIPYMGLLRIGQVSMVYLLAMFIVFVPTVVLPSLWGVYSSALGWLKGEKNLIVAALFVNSLVIAFTPFSTFRETGGIIRFATGLVLAVLLFAGRYRQRRVLNYSLFWVVLNVFLIK
jgi:hypothetical protein